MEVLDYLKLAQEYDKKKGAKYGSSVNLAIITNFTDDLLKKIVSGMCLSNDIKPEIFQTPYKQYLFELKNKKSKLWKHKNDITFIFFDINPYIHSEFSASLSHVSEVVSDIEIYCKNTEGIVVVHTAISPSSLQHMRVLKDHNLKDVILNYNEKIKKLSKEISNLYIIDTDNIVHQTGENGVRDMRGLYAFDHPFTNNFLERISREWVAFIKTIKGKIYKCIVLDLDNTLWGGVLGETGPLKIGLGHEYPGNAFLEFQRMLLNYYDRGLILAINSRNNPDDVYEVFEKNPHMLLKKHHFASIFANWNNKAENLKLIAKDLNIGLDSLVFIDDDAMNRDLVRNELPEVLVPEWNIKPEEYVKNLLNIDAFHTLNTTKEDREKGKMYAAERERKEVLTESSHRD
jgi:HAD superfamily phosphatase (TIGR01681 family)